MSYIHIHKRPPLRSWSPVVLKGGVPTVTKTVQCLAGFRATRKHSLHTFTLACGCCRPEDLCLTFTCANGLRPEVELVPHGADQDVTSSNWREYYNALLAWKLQGSIHVEVQAVKKGFLHIVDDRTMQLLHR